MVEKGHEYTKVAYDGRLQFHDVIKEYQLDIKNWIRIRDTESMYRSCWGLSNIISPFIRGKDRIKILKLIRECEQFNTRLNRAHSSDKMSKDYEKKVFQLYGMIMMSSAELMLPTKDREVEEFDWDEFERGSDL